MLYIMNNNQTIPTIEFSEMYKTVEPKMKFLFTKVMNRCVEKWVQTHGYPKYETVVKQFMLCSERHGLKIGADLTGMIFAFDSFKATKEENAAFQEKFYNDLHPTARRFLFDLLDGLKRYWNKTERLRKRFKMPYLFACSWCYKPIREPKKYCAACQHQINKVEKMEEKLKI